MRKFFSVLAAVCLLALFAVFSFKGDDLYALFSKNIFFAEADSLCDLSKNSCEAVFSADKSINLSVKPLKANENISFSVIANGFSDDELIAKIYGLNMNMGIFEFKLQKNNNSTYFGTVLLPACMSGEMTWRIEIISHKENLGGGFVVVI